MDGRVNITISQALIKFYGLNSEWGSKASEGCTGALGLLWLVAKGRNGLPKVTGTLLWKWLADLLRWPQSLGPAASHNPPQLLAVSPPLPRWWPNLEEVVGVESAVAYCRKGPETSNQGLCPRDLSFLLCLCRRTGWTSKLARLLFWLCIPGSTQEEDFV